ncbi:MAG: sensor histidine kinase [Roseburia sp.]|nr:sensor histidine kinase [Roseburia sp.]
MIGIILCVVLLFICGLLAVYILSMRRQLRSMRKELEQTEDTSYNRQLTIALFDRELTRLAVQMNHNLDYQKQLKRRTQQSELALRQSISDIAHDLRTPLTVIRGNLQLLEKDDKISGKSRERLLTCQNKVKALNESINDFFELSLLESDSSVVTLTPVNITKLLTQFILEHEAFIREHGLAPDIRLPERTVMILAEEQLLFRMLENLLVNVVKYAEGGFALSLEEPDGRRCRITFSNRIRKEQFDLKGMGRLFERNYRGSRVRAGEGAGLGLFIVKLLAQKQRAEAEAKLTGERLEISVLFQTPEV